MVGYVCKMALHLEKEFSGGGEAAPN